MCCSWSSCAAVLALFVSILLSPKVAPATFFDDVFEGLADKFSPVKPLETLPGSNVSSRWPDILPPRDPHCPPVYRSCEIAHSFDPRPSDVIITTAPKTGTTLLQFMAHLIRSGGDMNFTDLCDVAPWILANPLYKGDASAVPQAWPPRIFKNHQSLAEFKGGRHIVILRDPSDVLKSWYSFCMERRIVFMRRNGYFHLAASLFGLPDSVAEWWFGDTWKTELEFQRSSLGWRRDMSFGLDLLSYYVEFWHARHDPNVLLLSYEDVVSDRAQYAQAVAKFMGVKISPEQMDQVVQMTSKAFMLSHIDKFDGSAYSSLINAKGRVTVKWEGSAKVKTASYGELSTASLELLQHDWSRRVEPSTGLSTYAAMRATWQAETFKRR